MIIDRYSEIDELMYAWYKEQIELGKIPGMPNHCDTIAYRIFAAALFDENKILREAVAENKQILDALDKAREENKMLRLQIFAFVRNAAVLPVGRNLHKSEQEITDKTFETIEAAKAMLDVEAVRAAMNLATDKENRFDNAD